MPDPMLILAAIILAFAVSAAIVAILGRPWRPATPSAAFDAAWALGIGLAFFLGCWVVGDQPHWPPRSDQDRMLLLVIPAVVLVESLACVSRISPWLVWALRGLVVAANARVLLYGTSYITDVAGPGTSEWSTSQAWLIFGGLAALEAAVWALLALLARRVSGPSVPISLAIAIGGAGVTIMLSGYTTGGQAGLPLAAALLGATTAAAGFSRLVRGGGPPGVLIVALFSLLVVGRFFGRAQLGACPDPSCCSDPGMASRAALFAPYARLGAGVDPRSAGRRGGIGGLDRRPVEISSAISRVRPRPSQGLLR